jgi:hypothetical protein
MKGWSQEERQKDKSVGLFLCNPSTSCGLAEGKIRGWSQERQKEKKRGTHLMKSLYELWYS